jgi:CHAD domain-containing protein
MLTPSRRCAADDYRCRCRRIPLPRRPASGGGGGAAAIGRGSARLRGFVAHCVEQVLPCVDVIAEGRAAPEDVHRLRSALRRVRSLIRELPGWTPGLDPAWEAPLVEAFAALGAVRDRQVLVLETGPRLLRAGAPLASLDEPAGAAEESRRLVELLRGEPFQRALSALLAAGSGSRTGTGRRGRHGDAAAVSASLSRLWRRVERDARRFDRLEPARQHRVRKRLKRLRCLAEFAAPLYARRRVLAWLAQAEAAQACLGRHNDWVTAGQRFLEATTTDARAWFAVGWLRARTARSARACRQALARLRRADTFW